MSIGILLADDRKIFYDCFESLLNKQSGMGVIAVARTDE